MRRDAFSGERGLLVDGGVDVFAQDAFEAGARHRFAGDVKEELRGRRLSSHCQPGPQHCCGQLPQRQLTLTPPLAAHMDGSLGMEREFGDAEPRRKGQMQHCSIPDAASGVEVRRIQDCLHFLVSEIVDQLLVSPFDRDGLDATYLLQASRQAILEEAEERFRGTEACVASLRQIVTLGLDILEEVENQRRIELLDLKRGRCEAQAFGGEAHQQLEGIGIGVDRVWTYSPITRQIFLQESLEACRYQ